MDKAAIKEAVIDALAVSLEAQLKALQRLQKGQPEPKTSRKSMSQIDMVYDILQRAAQPWPRRCSGATASGAPGKIPSH